MPAPGAASPRPAGPRGRAETEAPACPGRVAGEEPCVLGRRRDPVAFSPEGGALSVPQGSTSIPERAVQRQGPASSATRRRLPPGPASAVGATVTLGSGEALTETLWIPWESLVLPGVPQQSHLAAELPSLI